MIVRFASAETERAWSGRFSRKLPRDVQTVALRKLRMLNQARRLAELRVPPGNRLESLTGNRAGQHSIRINEIVLGKRAITADTDLRLARYFGLSEGFWMGLQADYELPERRRQIEAEPAAIEPRAA